MVMCSRSHRFLLLCRGITWIVDSQHEAAPPVTISLATHTATTGAGEVGAIVLNDDALQKIGERHGRVRSRSAPVPGGRIRGTGLPSRFRHIAPRSEAGVDGVQARTASTTRSRFASTTTTRPLSAIVLCLLSAGASPGRSWCQVIVSRTPYCRLR